MHGWPSTRQVACAERAREEGTECVQLVDRAWSTLVDLDTAVPRGSQDVATRRWPGWTSWTTLIACKWAENLDGSVPSIVEFIRSGRIAVKRRRRTRELGKQVTRLSVACDPRWREQRGRNGGRIRRNIYSASDRAWRRRLNFKSSQAAVSLANGPSCREGSFRAVIPRRPPLFFNPYVVYGGCKWWGLFRMSIWRVNGWIFYSYWKDILQWNLKYF